MADISKIVLPDGSEYNIKDATARGLVVANPTLAGTESDLTGLQVNGTKYKIPSGGGSSISPYASNPAMDGTASPGSSNDYARGDHVHPSDTSKLGTSGDGSNVTVAFTAASSRTNISTGEKLSVLMGKIAKWFTDVGTAAFKGVDSAPTANSTNLVESGGVKSAINSCNNYGECSTAASTQAKVVSIATVTSLYTGLGITVKFKNNQTYNGVPTLNVSGTGAINVRYVSETNSVRYEWVAGEILDFIYDGTYWVIKDGGRASTSYYGVTKLYTGGASTSEAVALTPKTLNSLAVNSIWGYPAYLSSSTYAVGDRVRYSVGVYQCITAITTAESWTAAHWELIPTLQDQINGKFTAPTVSSSDNGKVLMVVNGAWTAANLPLYNGGVT